MEPLEQLPEPPILEVVSGVFFDPVPELDPLTFGTYWGRVRREFPTKELRPAVSDAGLVLAPVPPLRAMLFSTDQVYVLQVQNDRFYMNWRRVAVTDRYPRFSDHGEEKGIASLVVQRFAQFREFVREETGKDLAPRRVELAKVDVFAEGKHWNGLDDLALMLPWLKPFATFSSSPSPALGVRFDEPRDGGALSVTLASVEGLQPLYPPPTRALKLETRLTLELGPTSDLERTFAEANRQVNRVFAGLIPQSEREKRFKGGG